MFNLSESMLNSLSERELANELLNHNDGLIRRLASAHLNEEWSKEELLMRIDDLENYLENAERLKEECREELDSAESHIEKLENLLKKNNIDYKEL